MADDKRTEHEILRQSSSADRQEPGAKKRDDRRRSRSPQRDRHEDRPRRKDAGFKWKERRRIEDDEVRKESEGRPQRGYRSHYRPRSQSPRKGEKEPEATPRDLEHKEKNETKDRKEKKSTPAKPTEQPIRVFVNDRLGTKKEIPCYPSDSIKDFKAIVAMMIGRRPHEILLKRQGERPFKDGLSLLDYGVSNNVQLDLEVDTGD